MSDREENLDMFGVGNLSLSDLDKYAEELDEEESSIWPENVKMMYELLRDELQKAGADESIALALISAICYRFGGMQFYFGRGDALKAYLRNLQIWNDFTGDNVQELIEKYDMSYSAVYRILAKMRKREIQRRQPDLF
ncbi:transcriptional regulator [Vibrio cholerae]|nr:transcriptional regulator [Vibrio cholerae]